MNCMAKQYVVEWGSHKASIRISFTINHYDKNQLEQFWT